MLKLLRTTLLAAFALFPAKGWTADFPKHYVRLVVPFAPGGGVDVMARIVGQKLSELWGQQVVVENRGGGAGAIGAQVVASAPPDGYTLMLTADNVLTINPLIKKTSYDPIKSFSPISEVSSGAYIFAVNPEVKAKTLQEFVQLAKKNPGTFNYGTPGLGSLHHLAMEYFNHVTGTELVHVPYTGTGPALMAAIQGQVQVNFGSMAATLAQAKSGSIRPLATTGAERAPQLPNVPTVRESGYPEYEVTGWYGLLAPYGTPPEIVAKISADVKTVLAKPEVMQKLAEQGSMPVGSTPAQLENRIKHDLDQWSQLIKRANLKLSESN